MKALLVLDQMPFHKPRMRHRGRRVSSISKEIEIPIEGFYLNGPIEGQFYREYGCPDALDTKITQLIEVGGWKPVYYDTKEKTNV